jgi:NADPH:quinone reductase-like Zn-dependent oxidoreductase
MVFIKGAVKRGETVLIHAAGSGVGVCLIQLCKLAGARVIATASSEEKLKKARDLGADEVIDYQKEDFQKKVKELTGKKGVDAVLDSVGQAVWEKSLSCLAWNGRLVTCGATSGFEGKINLTHLFFRQLSLLGSTMGPKHTMFEIARLVEKKEIKPVVGAVLDLADARKAHELMENRKVFGKIVLRVGCK